MRLFLYLFLMILLCAPAAQAERMSWLENEHLRLGVDLDLGGAITFLSAKQGKVAGENVINNHDLGRQVQLSFFSGPVPYEAQGQKPADHWQHIGWNPIQAGDDFKHGGRTLSHKNDGQRIHVQCQPMQWPLNNIPGDCTFDSWLELDGPVVKAHARLTNSRSDKTPYPARLQELPAVYANAAFHRVVSYQGARPFTSDVVKPAPAAQGKHPWSFWPGTEGWAALLDDEDYGLGLITPGRVHFTGGFAGSPGPNDTKGNSTGYLAGQGREILDHNGVYDFHYELVLGTLGEIRAQAVKHRASSLPAWRFTKNRQGWYYQNAADTGWPLPEHLHVLLAQQDPQLYSPITFWNAADAPYLIVEAAFFTRHKHGAIMWQRHGQQSISAENNISFPIQGDGQFHTHIIHLGSAPGYQGAMLQLRLDPGEGREPDGWVKIKSVRLSAKGQ